MFFFLLLEVTDTTVMAEDGMELEETAKDATQESVIPAEPELPSEFDRLFKSCEENPEDFNAWVALLQYVEQEVCECVFLELPPIFFFF